MPKVELGLLGNDKWGAARRIRPRERLYSRAQGKCEAIRRRSDRRAAGFLERVG